MEDVHLVSYFRCCRGEPISFFRLRLTKRNHRVVPLAARTRPIHAITIIAVSVVVVVVVAIHDGVCVTAFDRRGCGDVRPTPQCSHTPWIMAGARPWKTRRKRRKKKKRVLQTPTNVCNTHAELDT